MGIASIGITLLEIMPKVFQVVKAVEAATAEQQEANPTGSQKLSFALGLLETYYETLDNKVPFSDLQQAITKVITVVVMFYKDTKIFKSKKAQEPQVVANG